jgi:hypothetical protein
MKSNMNTLNIKLMAVVAALSIIIGACSDQHQYDANTMAALQPCMSMGFQPAQCMAAYQQAGRPQSSDTNWLGTVAAFAAGAAANHWWNRPSYQSYQYHPEYMNQPDYYDRYYNTPQRRTWVTPQVRGIPQTTNPSVPQLVPEKNTNQLIPGQKIQPLFANPTNIAPNQATPKPVTTPPATATATQSFKPIQVVPPTTSTQAATTATQFKPVQVTPPPAPAPVAKKPSSSWSLFGGSTSTKSTTPPSVASKPASKPSSTFAPIRVSPPKSSSSSSSSSSRRK